MGKRLNYTLSDEEVAVLEEAINHAPEPELRHRTIAIRLLHLGQTPEQVAQAVMVTSNTFYAWHIIWRENGVAGLRDGQRSGRPTKADKHYTDELARVHELDPHTLDDLWMEWQDRRAQLHQALDTVTSEEAPPIASLESAP